MTRKHMLKDHFQTNLVQINSNVFIILLKDKGFTEK